jgi:alkanesulfonate monooxygenase SsuD/methylene tetrahydromethanopterin reductase-like flavin-dependent oxidoreductase (luciferase family)
VSLQIGLYVPTWHFNDGSTPRWPEIRALARDAEALGVDTLWVADEPGFWECWTILTAVAGATERIGIGPLVACTRYRNPAFLATMIRALDEASGGRLTVGLGSGAGAGDKRWGAFGYDGSSHVSRFAEAVEVIARLVRTGPIDFEGRFYRVAQPNIGPEGPQGGRVPFWVAARRPRTMEVAARWGDTANANSPLVDRASVAAFRADLNTACAAVGRDPTTIRMTGWTRVAPSVDGSLGRDRKDTIAGTPAQIAERLAELHDAGVDHLTCFVGDEDDEHAYPALTPRSLARFAAVMETLRD